MKIVPSILSDTYDDFLFRLAQAATFTDYVQIDIMDGKFVGTKSFPADMISSAKSTLGFEVHLMTRSPAVVAAGIRHPGLKKVIYHFEAVENRGEVVQLVKNRGLEVGLAVNPGTTLEAIRDAAEGAETLLFLTVEPGRYGSPFRAEVIDKVREARKVFGRKTIGVDGGVSLDNLDVFIDIGVDYACVGSRIFFHGRPEENYRAFLGRVGLFEGREDRG